MTVFCTVQADLTVDYDCILFVEADSTAQNILLLQTCCLMIVFARNLVVRVLLLNGKK